MSYQWKAYINQYYRSDLLDRWDLQQVHSQAVYPFRCPECDKNFINLSGLF